MSRAVSDRARHGLTLDLTSPRLRTVHPRRASARLDTPGRGHMFVPLSAPTVASPTSPEIEQQLAAWEALFASPDADVAHLLCDRHDPAAVAFAFPRYADGELQVEELTFGALREESARFAAALHAQGVGRGDSVAVLMGKSRSLVVALLGIWRLGAVHVPL